MIKFKAINHCYKVKRVKILQQTTTDLERVVTGKRSLNVEKFERYY